MFLRERELVRFRRYCFSFLRDILIIDKEEFGYRFLCYDVLVLYKFLVCYGKNFLKVIVVIESWLLVFLIFYY